MNGYSIRRLAPALPVALLLLATVWQLGWERTGSIAAVDWLAVALVAGLALAVVLASGGAVTVPRLGLLGLGGLVALAAWTGISLLWSPLPTLGSDEVQLLLFDTIALALALFTLRGPVDRIAALACVALVPAGVAIAVAVRLLGTSDVDPYFDGGRLQLPVTYANAEAALFLIGLWPALALAAGRALPIWLRVPALAAAALSLSGWLATQSKGGGIGLIASALVVFAVSPGRLRLAVPALVAAGIVAAAAAPLTSPYRADSDAIAAAADDAGRALFAVLAAGLLLGAAYVVLDRRTSLSPQAVRRAGLAAGALTLAAVVAGAAVLVAATGRPDRSLGRAWAAFSEYHPDTGGTATHLVTLGGSNRYDFWRVALAGAADDPVQGIGARGFGPLYLQEGRSHETPARTHSLVFETLLEEGIVGLALLLVALLPLLLLAARGARRRSIQGVAALGGGIGFLAHASVDWTWTFPSVSIPFFVLLGIGAGGRRELIRRRSALLGGAAVAVATVILLGLPWLSGRLVRSALLGSQSASEQLTWARRLDPISVDPLYARARLAATAADALPPLREAVRKEPGSVLAHYLLGTTLLAAGERSAAVEQLREARRLAPRDEFVQAALERARA